MKQQQQNIHSAIELHFLRLFTFLKRAFIDIFGAENVFFCFSIFFLGFQCFNMSLQSKEFLSFSYNFFFNCPSLGFFIRRKISIQEWCLHGTCCSEWWVEKFFCFSTSLRSLDTETSRHKFTFFPLPLVCIVIHLLFFSITRDVSRLLFSSSTTLHSNHHWHYFSLHRLFTSCIIVTGSPHGRRDCSARCSALVVEILPIQACCSLEYWRHLSGKWEIML